MAFLFLKLIALLHYEDSFAPYYIATSFSLKIFNRIFTCRYGSFTRIFSKAFFSFPFLFDNFFGTFSPFSRASDKAIAIACFLLVTFLRNSTAGYHVFCHAWPHLPDRLFFWVICHLKFIWLLYTNVKKVSNIVGKKLPGLVSNKFKI